MATKNTKPTAKTAAKPTPAKKALKAPKVAAIPKAPAVPAKKIAKKAAKPKVQAANKTDKVSKAAAIDDELQLMVIFCDRLNQICDRRPDVIRKGRGRVNDIADKFKVHYTTAYRLLNTESLPNCVLLRAIADAFDVSESWLLGRGPADVDDLIDNSSIKIHIFKPRSADNALFASIPASELPPGFDSSKLLFTRVRTETGEEEDVIVLITAEAQEGRVHLFYDPETETTFLRRVNLDVTRGQLHSWTTSDAKMTKLSSDDVVFGELKEAKKLSIVGPVVSRILYKFKGD